MDAQSQHVRCLLEEAHRALSAGAVTAALQHTLQAAQLTGGSTNAAESMQRVVSGLQQSSVPSAPPPSPQHGQRSMMDDISELFQQISLHAAPREQEHPSAAQAPPQPHQQPNPLEFAPSGAPMCEPTQQQHCSGPGTAAPPSRNTQPILVETGREAITQCSLQAGVSYVCESCQGIVPTARRWQHEELWCPRGHLQEADPCLMSTSGIIGCQPHRLQAASQQAEDMMMH